MKIITLQTKHTTYQMGVHPLGFLLHLYYGAKTEGDMSYLLLEYDRGFAANPYDAGDERGFSMDVMPQEFPCYGCGDFRSPAFCARTASGVSGVDLRYREHRIVPGKYAIPGMPAVYADDETDCYTLEVTLADAALGVTVTLKYGVLPELDVITRSADIRNTGAEDIYIQKALSATLDFATGDFELLHFHGRHTMERNLERVPLMHGMQSFGSRRGTSSHQHNPFAILAGRETTEENGMCYGMSLLYSGNFTFEAQLDQYAQTRMQMGMPGEMMDYVLVPGESLHTPEAAMVFTTEGLSELSHLLHRLIRDHVCRGVWKNTRRPVLINNWEATYFDFSGEKLVAIAQEAAALGVEMLVLDDGWFGKRDDDNSGLGDWYVNEKKLGGTLGELSEKINALGMKFGLWIEPEMVNEDSKLYRKHPEWAFAIPGRKPCRCRNQLVLDFSRREVVDYVFTAIAKVIDSANISYIKMDMNRSICDVFTAAEGYQNYGKVMHRYVLGVYDFLERLTTRYPHMLIEGCSGGGGRFDAGMLYYTPQIWCSDNTDAIERIRIQHGTSFGYPISAVGSHVSAVPNHQTHRSTPLRTRGIVAMAGTFGYELDLNLLSVEEKELVKRQIQDYKRYWHLIHNGAYYRLHDPGRDTQAAAWCFVSEDKQELLLQIVSLDAHGNAPLRYIRCRGLDAHRRYRCMTEEREIKTDTKGIPRWDKKDLEGKVFDGNSLMYAGLPVPMELGEYEAMQVYFRCI